MKKPITFDQAVSENSAKYIESLPYTAGFRKPRRKPRSIEESIGISIATAELVRDAYKTGRLVRKYPKGFVLNPL